MGNSASGAATRVISSDGSLRREYSLRRARHVVTAAELMLDNPGHFVCDSSRLEVGRRIPGLATDAELKPGRLYFLLPVDLLYSVLTDEEMAIFARSASNSARPRSYISRKIFPVLSELCLIPSDVEKVVVESARRADEDFEVTKQRSWRPALDTIREVDGSPKVI